MKKYLKFAVMAAFALVTVYNVYKVQTEVVLSDAQLKNVEALAGGEGGSDETSDCVNFPDRECWLPIVTPTESYMEVHWNQVNYYEIIP